MAVQDPADVSDRPRSSGRWLHAVLAAFRPGGLALASLLVTLAVRQDVSAGRLFGLHRLVELLVLTAYLREFIRHSPSFLELACTALIGSGFVYLVAQGAWAASATIAMLVLAWLVMSWLGRHWPPERGFSTLALFWMVLMISQEGWGAWAVPRAGSWTSLVLILGLISLLALVVLASSSSWKSEKMPLRASRRTQGLFWSTCLVMAPLWQVALGMIEETEGMPWHRWSGLVTAGIVILAAWQSRLWLGTMPALRWLPPALAFMPVNQVVLGLYSAAAKERLLPLFHAANGLLILALSLLAAFSTWAAALGMGFQGGQESAGKDSDSV